MSISFHLRFYCEVSPRSSSNFLFQINRCSFIGKVGATGNLYLSDAHESKHISLFIYLVISQSNQNHFGIAVL